MGQVIEVNIRYFMFLSLGIERRYTPADSQDGRYQKLLEPHGSIVCRRNILALAGILVLAGGAGVNPQDLSVLGIRVSEGRGVLAFGVAVILAHLYWYAMRFQHLIEDGKIPPGSIHLPGGAREPGKAGEQFFLERKTADLWANRVAVFLTLLSWIFVALWICGLDV